MPAPTPPDIIGLIIWYALAGLVLWSAERLHDRGQPAWLTRKFVHVMAGLSVYELVIVVEHWQWGLVPFATFVPVNAWLTWGRPPASFGKDDATPGPFYFAVVITLLLGLTWPSGNEGVAVAVLSLMIFGDAAAAIVGQLYGRRRYRIWAYEKSIEGSAAMFGVAAMTCAITLVLFAGEEVAPAVGSAIAIAAVATLAEALTPHGLDNLTVPLSGSAIFVLISRTIG